MKSLLLTFDLEEFDLPKEFGHSISDEQIFEISKEGLMNVLVLLKKYNLKVTFFTTALFAKKYQYLFKKISKEHEIACHGHSHSDSYLTDISKIKQAKVEIEKIIGKKIIGFRAPRFEIKDPRSLAKFNFIYDSSIHPTWIPGRYCNMFKRRKIHNVGKIKEIPLSVLPVCRLPIFWIAFKNFPLIYSKLFTKINFLFGNYTMLVFHPWEFADLSSVKIPGYIKKRGLLIKLEEYIKFCKKKNYNFTTVGGHFQKSLR